MIMCIKNISIIEHRIPKTAYKMTIVYELEERSFNYILELSFIRSVAYMHLLLSEGTLQH